MVDINEGFTNNYLVHGFFLILGSAPLIYFHFLFWLPFFAIAIALFMSSTGLLIDTKNQKFKAYKRIVGFNRGKWIDTKGIDTIILKFLSISQNAVHPMILGSMKVKTFKSANLVALTKDKNQYTLYTFAKYSIARSALNAFSSIPDIETIDTIKEQLIKNKINKRR